MSQASFENNFEELLSVTVNCFNNKHTLPGMILLYAHIDIAASLNRPESKAEATRADFKEWVNDYLLPNSNLTCSADDIYAARCGFLHAYSAESRASRAGEAKQIFYAWGKMDADDLQRRLSHTGLDTLAIGIHIDSLFHAYQTGIRRFMDSVVRDSAKSKLVYKRADKFLANIPKSRLRPLPSDGA